MNRRSFLAASAAMSGGFLPGGLAPAQAADPERQFQLGCVTYNLLKDMDLETIIHTLETTGLAAVELRTTHKHGVEPSIGPDARAAVRERFTRTKVRLLSYGTECEFQSPDAAVRQHQVEIGKSFVDLARDTGAIGVKDRFGDSGAPWELVKELQVSAEHIACRTRPPSGISGRACAIWASTANRKGSKFGWRSTARPPASPKPRLTSSPPPAIRMSAPAGTAGVMSKHWLNMLIFNIK